MKRSTLDFSENTVLITGGAGDIGKATALAFAQSGARIVLADKDSVRVAEVAAELQADNYVVASYEVDVGDSGSCERLAEQVKREIGDISVLVNNAGVTSPTKIDDQDAVDHWERMIKVNLSGVFHMSRAFVGQLRATSGSIVNVSSVAGFVAISGVFGYSAAKAGVRSLTQVLARELGADGIRVNAVAPSVIATRMTIPRRQDKEFMDRVMSRTPSGRMGDPEDVAWPIVFLASPLACYINGVTLPVDGGYLAT